MSREALKFTDITAFLSLMEDLGFSQQAREVLYEGDKLPYCSAYLIPTDLLPSGFDDGLISQFGGTITRVEAINYLGTERFKTSFMVYPLSLTGYVEVADAPSAATFAGDTPERSGMSYVINLEDGGGQEFYMAVGGKLISLSDQDQEEPQEFKTFKLMAKKMEQIRPNYPPVCRIYGVERREFNDRRRRLQKPAPGDPPAIDKN